MESRSALIAGATGAVGSCLLKLLLSSPRYERVYALSRRALPEAEKLKTLEVDFDNLESTIERGTVTDVFCALGTTMKKAGSKAAFRKVDHDYVLNVAWEAQRAGAKRFVLNSSVGAATRASSFYLRVKGEVETAIRALDYRAVHILQPSILLAERNERRIGEAIAQKLAPLYNPLLGGKLRKYRAITAQDVAAGMLGAALSEDKGVHIHTYDQILSLAKTM